MNRLNCTHPSNQPYKTGKPPGNLGKILHIIELIIIPIIKNIMSIFTNFLITENGTTFLFPAGQVSCHAMGAWSIEISYSELKDLLKDGIPKIYLE